MVKEVDLLLLSTREGLSASVRDDRRVQLSDAHSIEIGASARSEALFCSCVSAVQEKLEREDEEEEGYVMYWT